MSWWPDGRRKQFAMYIMSNDSMTLYTGVTNELDRRIWQHTHPRPGTFTARYHFDRCVYFELYERIVDAIAREKQIKGWTRARKIALIKSVNPGWMDLIPLS